MNDQKQVPREAVVDTNVLIRLLIEDPPEMAQLALEIIHSAQTRNVDLVLAPMTVAEVVFVLQSFYGWSREAISTGLLELLSASIFIVFEESTVRQAMEWYRDVPGVHFADAYCAALATERGHHRVVSFDRALRRVPGIRLIRQTSDLEPD